MKNFTLFILLCFVSFAALGQRFPIKNGYLQSNLDGNQFDVTNVHAYYGDGSHLTGITNGVTYNFSDDFIMVAVTNIYLKKTNVTFFNTTLLGPVTSTNLDARIVVVSNQVISGDATTLANAQTYADSLLGSFTIGTYNVTHPPYYADRTGVTNAQVAIQTAVNDAEAAGGGAVYIPAGIYKLGTNFEWIVSTVTASSSGTNVTASAGTFGQYGTGGFTSMGGEQIKLNGTTLTISSVTDSTHCGVTTSQTISSTAISHRYLSEYHPGSINIHSNNIYIIGDGFGLTTLKQDVIKNGDQNVFNSNNTTNIGIFNMTVDGSGLNIEGSQFYFNDVVYFNHVKWQNLGDASGETDAMDTQYGNRVYINGCITDTVKGNAVSTQDAYIKVSDCDFNGGGQTESGTFGTTAVSCLDVYADVMEIDNVRISGTYAVFMRCPASQLVSAIHCNWVSTNLNVTNIYATAGVTRMTDCTITGANDSGSGNGTVILVNTNASLIMDNCRVYGNQTILAKSPGAIRITDSTITAAYHGIRLIGGTGAQIEDNTIAGGSSSAIRLDDSDSAYPTHAMIISGNYLSGNLHMGMGTNHLVEGNTFLSGSIRIWGSTYSHFNGNVSRTGTHVYLGWDNNWFHFNNFDNVEFSGAGAVNVLEFNVIDAFSGNATGLANSLVRFNTKSDRTEQAPNSYTLTGLTIAGSAITGTQASGTESTNTDTLNGTQTITGLKTFQPSTTNRVTINTSGLSQSNALGGTVTSGNSTIFTNSISTNVISSTGMSLTQSANTVVITNGAITASGAITGGTINGLTISGSSGTLTVPSGASLITSGAFSLTLTATATSVSTFPAGTKTLLATDGSGASLTALNATQLTSGTVPTARLGTGTANTQAFLRGDQTWFTNKYLLNLPTNMSCFSSVTPVTSADSVTLPAGRYKVYGIIKAYTVSTTAGVTAQLQFSTECTTNTLMLQQIYTASSADITYSTPTLASTVMRSDASIAAYICSPYVDAPNKFAMSVAQGQISFASATTVNFYVIQRSATDAVNATILSQSSFVVFEPIY